jgi:hypothetical protein
MNDRWLRSRLVLVTLAALIASGCDDPSRYDQAVCVLIDVSGTYADQRKEVVRIVKSEVLPNMEPGDTLVVVRIDGEGYEKNNLEALVTFDQRPSRANAQKLALAQKLDEMATRRGLAQYTDIPGAMMLGGEYLRELASGSSLMIVFSDMQEDLAPGTTRELRSDEFTDIHVVAMNVKRLKTDSADPAVYRKRMADWEKRILAAGGLDWKTFMDPRKVSGYLTDVRES